MEGIALAEERNWFEGREKEEENYLTGRKEQR